LGVRISPPLPYLRRLISKDMSLFAIGVKITLILIIKNSIMQIIITADVLFDLNFLFVIDS
ncbi:TPA: hypothetical protein ACX6PJ_003169, partial [Photobacterium damselae]